MMQTPHERGIAMILALFLMTALSALGASLMFLSQTETYASMNYRMMSQGRYAAESAVQKASDHLLGGAYPIPAASDIGPIYDTTKSPVICVSGCPNVNQPVVLSAISPCQAGVNCPNYPVAAVQTAFDTAAKGTLTAGNVNLTYGAYAVLISMQKFDSYGGTQDVVQTWQITGDGSVVGSRPATVEVVSLIETPKVPANSFAAFATADTCGALTFNGNITIDSYDSTGMMGAGAPTLDPEDGDVGSNGNLTIVGGAANVDGNLYTPRTGVGTCSSGSVTAFTGSTATIAGSIVPLPKAINYPTPAVPMYSLLPATPSINSATGACALMGLVLGVNCSENAGTGTITVDGSGTELTMPSITLGGGTKLVLAAGSPPAKYNFNSIDLNGGSSIGISATSSTQAALVNVIGKDNTGADIATPLDLVGGTFAAVTGCGACSNYDASMLQFIYAGTGQINLTGNSGSAATVYAPNAAVEFSGTADLYGSVLGKTINNIGSGNIHYDRSLQSAFFIAGLPMASTFTWKRF